jgi:hypothetical protein
MKFTERKCWDKSDFEQVFPAQANTQREEYFLVTHSPFRSLIVDRAKTELSTNSDQELFKRIAKQGSEQHLVFIKGDPGTGKSHLIRWLYHSWQRSCPKDEAIFIPRRDATLVKTIERLIEHLGDEFSDIAQSLKQVSFELTGLGLKKELINKLTISINPAANQQPIPNIEIFREAHFLSVLESARVKTHLEQDGSVISRVVDRLVDSGETEASQDYNIEKFSSKDIIDISNKFSESLGQNGDHFRSVVNDDQKLAKLVIALNERMSVAQQATLSLSPNDLNKVITDLRRRVYQQDKDRRLVLLIEDVSCFQGVDKELIDTVATETEVGSNLCTLIAVVGITSQYFEQDIQPQGHILDRETYRIDLSSKNQVDTQSILFEDLGDFRSFVSRYLNASRMTDSQVDNWYKGGGSAVEEIPNPCLDCPDNEVCHQSFGDYDGFGLYPLNLRFIDNLAKSVISQSDAAKSVKVTPRTVVRYLRFVLEEALNAPGQFLDQKIIAGHLSENRLPHLEVDDGKIIENLFGSQSSQVKVLTTLWGDVSTQVTKIEGETLAFSGLRDDVFTVFNIPAKYSDIEPETGPGPIGDIGPEIEPSPTNPDPAPEAAPDIPPENDGRTTFYADVDRWLRGEGALENDENIRSDLQKLFTRVLQFTTIGVAKPLWRPYLQASTIYIEGQRTQRPRSPILELPRTREVGDALKSLWDVYRADEQEVKKYDFRKLSLLYKFVRTYSDDIVGALEKYKNAMETRNKSIITRCVEILALNAVLNTGHAVNSGEFDAIKACFSESQDVDELALGDWNEVKETLKRERENIQQSVLNWLDQDPTNTQQPFINPTSVHQCLLEFLKDFEIGKMPGAGFLISETIIKAPTLRMLMNFEDKYYNALSSMGEQSREILKVATDELLTGSGIIDFYSSVLELCRVLKQEQGHGLDQLISNWERFLLRDEFDPHDKNQLEHAWGQVEDVLDQIDGESHSDRVMFDVMVTGGMPTILTIAYQLDAGIKLIRSTSEVYPPSGGPEDGLENSIDKVKEGAKTLMSKLEYLNGNCQK